MCARFIVLNEVGHSQSSITALDTTATHKIPKYITRPKHLTPQTHTFSTRLLELFALCMGIEVIIIDLVRETQTSTYTLIRTPLHTICYQGNESPVEEGSEQLLGYETGESLRVGESNEWKKVFESVRVMTW